MPDYISLESFKKPNGFIDWDLLRNAEKNAGQRCFQCGQFIGRPAGHPSLCSECNALMKSTEAQQHSRLIRCPKCKHVFQASDFDDGTIYEEDDTEITCPECEHDFTVTTHVSYTFTSPPIIEEDE